jgi:hypothetical protein
MEIQMASSRLRHVFGLILLKASDAANQERLRIAPEPHGWSFKNFSIFQPSESTSARIQKRYWTTSAHSSWSSEDQLLWRWEKFGCGYPILVLDASTGRSGRFTRVYRRKSLFVGNARKITKVCDKRGVKRSSGGRPLPHTTNSKSRKIFDSVSLIRSW